MVVREILGANRIEIETGGYVRFDVQLTNSAHKHDYFEICLVLGGSGNYHHGGRTFELSAGTVFLAEPGVVHEITSFTTRDLHLYFVTLTLHSLDAPSAGQPDEIVNSFLSARQVTSRGHERLALYLPLLAEGSQGAEFASKQVLKLMTLEMLNSLCEQPISGEERREEDEIARAFEFIDRNLDRRLPVNEIAGHLGLSERSLRRRFREKMGSTIVEEINHRRMRRAAHRLLMGFGVQEVADFIGVADPAQFTRSFTRAFGVSPKQFQGSYIPGSLAKKTRPGEW